MSLSFTEKHFSSNTSSSTTQTFLVREKATGSTICSPICHTFSTRQHSPQYQFLVGYGVGASFFTTQSPDKRTSLDSVPIRLSILACTGFVVAGENECKNHRMDSTVILACLADEGPQVLCPVASLRSHMQVEKMILQLTCLYDLTH